MNILRHTLNIIGGLIVLIAGTALVVFLSTTTGPETLPVAFILCLVLVLVPAVAHVIAATSVWRLGRGNPNKHSTLIGLVAATIATFVWLTFVLTLSELIVRNASGVPAWQLAVSFLVACIVPLASALNFLLLWRILSAHLRSRAMLES